MSEPSAEVLERRNGIGLRLRTLRKAAGLTADEVGVRVGEAAGGKPLKGTAIRNHENGWNGVPRPLLSAYADLYGASLAYVMLGQGDEPTVIPEPRAPKDALHAYLTAVGDGGAHPSEAQWAKVLQLAGIK